MVSYRFHWFTPPCGSGLRDFCQIRNNKHTNSHWALTTLIIRPFKEVKHGRWLQNILMLSAVTENIINNCQLIPQWRNGLSFVTVYYLLTSLFWRISPHQVLLATMNVPERNIYTTADPTDGKMKCCLVLRVQSYSRSQTTWTWSADSFAFCAALLFDLILKVK